VTRGEDSAAGVFADAFLRRARFAAQSSGTLIDDPGLMGLRQGDGRVSLLVADDDGLAPLTAMLGEDLQGVIRVLPAASRTRAMLEAQPRWATESLTAMVCGDLAAVPDVPLPEGVTLRPVWIESGGADPGGADGSVDLVAVTAMVVEADPAAASEDPERMAASLRAIRPAPGFYAAVDGSGAVRATSGWRVFGQDASIFFINTHQDWRRRGIGRSMTAAALHAARRAGVTRACLDATEAGSSIYLSVGFESAGPMAEFANFG
jgi:GNAT superfamily N-acetyltransferase